jgi:hypothetical protein
MANVVYNISKSGVLNGTVDLDTNDIRILLVKTGSTAEADIDADTISAIGTLNELTVSGYARQAFANETVTTDDTNDRGQFTADTVTFSALATGETIIGAIVYKHVGADSSNVPICFLDLTDTPTNGGDVVVTFPNGILRAT